MAQSGSRSGGRRTPIRRGATRVQKIWSDNAELLASRAGTRTRSTRAPRIRSSPAARLLDIAAERGAEPFDMMLDLALDEPDLGLRVGCVLAQRRRRRGRLAARPRSTARSGCPTRARTWASCATRPRPPTSSATGCATATLMPIEQAVRKLTGVPGRHARARPTGASCAPGNWADVVVFDPATVAPGPIRRVRDFPADAERLTADQPDRRPPRRGERDAHPGRRHADRRRVRRRARPARPGRPQPTPPLTPYCSWHVSVDYFDRSVPRTPRSRGETKW